MMATVEIWDGPSVGLADVLARVSDVDSLRWTVMEMWAVARDDDFDLVALEQKAEGSPSGLELSAAELRRLAAELRQLIDGIVVGYRAHAPQRTDDDLRETADIVIEAIDSTCWRVFARDPALIADLRREFDDVREVVPERPIPPVHEES